MAALELPEQSELRTYLLINNAYAQTVAGDFSSAIETYNEVLTQLNNLTRSSRASCRAGSYVLHIKNTESPVVEINYEVKPFSHLYYSAAFVLGDDWQ